MSSNNEFDNDNFEKIFNEIVNSDELKDISDSFQKSLQLGVKEMLLIQQALCDAVSNISEILINFHKNPSDKISKDDEQFDLLGSLYKIAEDFNDYMIESSEDIIFAFEDDEEEFDVLGELEEREYEDDEDGDIE